MKIEYFPDTDSIYFELKEDSESVISQEAVDGFVLDLDKNGSVIGIDICSNASQKIDLDRIDFIRRT